MRRQVVAGLLMLVVFTVITGVVYPFVVTGIAQVFFREKADGSLLYFDGHPVGSALIGQEFTKAKYFHPRPSAAGAGYDGSASSGSNKGPTDPAFLSAVGKRVAAYRAENGLAPNANVPVDAVTASASGLDPEISTANARIQAKRVATARHLPEARVLALVQRYTDGRGLGFLGEPGVNVLEVNLALDRVR
jgi:K+-transporting ATPase ATPase C chain